MQQGHAGSSYDVRYDLIFSPTLRAIKVCYLLRQKVRAKPQAVEIWTSTSVFKPNQIGAVGPDYLRKLRLFITYFISCISYPVLIWSTIVGFEFMYEYGIVTIFTPNNFSRTKIQQLDLRSWAGSLRVLD